MVSLHDFLWSWQSYRYGYIPWVLNWWYLFLLIRTPNQRQPPALRKCFDRVSFPDGGVSFSLDFFNRMVLSFVYPFTQTKTVTRCSSFLSSVVSVEERRGLVNTDIRITTYPYVIFICDERSSTFDVNFLHLLNKGLTTLRHRKPSLFVFRPRFVIVLAQDS